MDTKLIRVLLSLLALAAASPALGQSFSCRIGTQPACLDYGDKVCSSSGMCVDRNAACFDQYQCNYEGFTCKSNVTECVEAHDSLLRKQNELVDDFNENLARAAALVVLHAELHLRLPFEELIKPAARKSYSAAITMDGDPTGVLAGSVVVFTGALGMSRSEAAELAARAGMSVKAGVTKETTHLVVGDQDLSVLAGHTKSSKHRKAEDMQRAGHPIRIIGESAFKSLVAESKAS